MKKLAYMALSLTLLLAVGVAAAEPTVTVYQDEALFIGATGAAEVLFPADADSALSMKPWSYAGHSCEEWSFDVVSGVTVTAPSACTWVCYVDADWPLPPSNTDPHPVGPTIIANCEDDYVLSFANPVYAVAFELLTNYKAEETITLTFDDGTTMAISDADLDTLPNAFEFVGFKSTAPIVSVEIDTTGGASQNEGISGIWVAYQASIDIKPGSYPNSINLGSNGVIPVAVLTTDTFDASTVDPFTVKLAGSEVRVKGKSGNAGSLEDVDGDGDVDLVIQVLNELTLEEGATTAMLQGLTYDGMAFIGYDEISIVPPE